MSASLRKFFDFLDEEDFQKGADYFAKEAGLPDTRRLEEADLFEEAGRKTKEERLPLFCAAFLAAKEIVEISYSYGRASTLYTCAAELLDGENPVPKLKPLADFARLQALILKIDRGIYTGFALQMDEGARELAQLTESLLEELGSGRSDPLLQEKLQEKLEETAIYADAIRVTAGCYLDRWNPPDDFTDRIEQIEKSVERLEDLGNRRLASDLEAHIHVLKKFLEARGENGKLHLKDGEVTFYYHAAVDYDLRNDLNDFLKRAADGDETAKAKLDTVLGKTPMVAEMMGDIWSGLSSEEYIDTYRFELGPLQIEEFRDIGTLEAECTLRYYTMGVFELRIAFAIDRDHNRHANTPGISVTALRHLQSLGTPFALDETIWFHEEKWSYLLDFVRNRFETLRNNIKRLTIPDIPEEREVIAFDPSQKRHTLVRINHIDELFPDGRRQRIHPADFCRHFQFKAIVMPVREVRTAIDNWILYDDRYIPENIAGIRYNASEWMSVDPYSSLVALLEQPVWVFDQAIETVEVAVVVLNMLQLSNDFAAAQMEILQRTEEEEEEPADRIRTLERQIATLDRFRDHLSAMLETVAAGTLMTYPDHTALMERILKLLHLERAKERTFKMQAHLQEIRRKRLEAIKRLNEKIFVTQQKVIKLFVSIATVFITLGSLSDLFQIWQNSETIKNYGLLLSGDMKLIVVLVLASVAIVWLLYDYQRNTER